MKGNEKLLEVLNTLLADELTAINQYMVHSEMCENWGYEKLHKAIRKTMEIEDQVTVDLLTLILKMEEGHVDWAEKQQVQINQMGLENYLLMQTEKESVLD